MGLFGILFELEHCRVDMAVILLVEATPHSLSQLFAVLRRTVFDIIVVVSICLEED